MQTDLPHLQMPCQEIHDPWWFRRSSNHRPKNPPTGSELSLKSLCCCQPWQEPKEAPNCPSYQKLQGTNRGRHRGRTWRGREEGERTATREKRRRVTTVKPKAKNTWHDFKYKCCPSLTIQLEKATCLWTVITLVKTMQCGWKVSFWNFVICLVVYITAAVKLYLPGWMKSSSRLEMFSRVKISVMATYLVILMVMTKTDSCNVKEASFIQKTESN